MDKSCVWLKFISPLQPILRGSNFLPWARAFYIDASEVFLLCCDQPKDMPNFRLGALRENVAEDCSRRQPWQQPRSLESQLVSPTADNLVSCRQRVTDDSSRPFLSLQLNSEYRSTFQWHDLARPSALKQDVIRRPPSSKDYGTTKCSQCSQLPEGLKCCAL